MGVVLQQQTRWEVDNITKQEEQQQQQFKAQKVASLLSVPPPPPPPVPNNNPNRPRAVTNKQPLQPRPAKQQPNARQLKTTTTHSHTAIMSDAETAIITQVYGPTANIYTDILSVSPTASQQEIREAFFCLRYGIYQQLSEEGDANGPLSQEERKKVEMKMDAISASFQILSDRNKRKMYDDSLAEKQGGRGGVGGQGGALSANTRDSPAAAKQVKQQSALSIAQRRSQYRRQMNAQQRRPMRPIEGAMNERKVPAPIFVGQVQPEEDEEEDEAPSPNVRGMSIREQMMSAQQHNAKKISIKTTEEVIDQRQDKEESPTAVDEFDSVNKFKNVKLDDNKSGNHREVKSPEPDEGTYDEDDGTYDDDSQTYGTYDDQTYDDGSYYTYGDTTTGTYDDSTYVTYDDDQTYETYEDRGKYSPSHKTGDMPEPILKGSTPGKKDNKKKAKRVTIHSHRGKGESDKEGFAFPGFDDAYEELSGTYKDFKDTLNQVGSAFFLSPDDIDKMSDKIRDAHTELIENYEKQSAGRQQNGKKGAKLLPRPSKSKKAIKK